MRIRPSRLLRPSLDRRFGFENGTRTAQLHFRFVASPTQIAKFTEIRLNFWLDRSNEAKPFRPPVKFANTAAKFAVALRLAFKRAGAVKTHHLQIIYSDGTL